MLPHRVGIETIVRCCQEIEFAELLSPHYLVDCGNLAILRILPIFGLKLFSSPFQKCFFMFVTSSQSAPEEVVNNKKRKGKTDLDRAILSYLDTFAREWAYPDTPRAWKKHVSRELGYHDTWVTNLYGRLTSIQVTEYEKLCRTLDSAAQKTAREKKCPAPPLSFVIAVLHGSRIVSGGTNLILPVNLTLSSLLWAQRQAREQNMSVESWGRSKMLADYEIS